LNIAFFFRYTSIPKKGSVGADVVDFMPVKEASAKNPEAGTAPPD